MTTPLRLTLMSTSNGLIKGGISTVLAEYFELYNVSKGACSSGLGLYNIAITPEILESDIILVDFAINDNEHLVQGWVDEGQLELMADRLYAALSRSDARVFVLLMPVYRYINDPLASRGVQLHTRLAEKYGFPVIDGYAFVEECPVANKADLFMDMAHLDRCTASVLASAIADYIIAGSFPRKAVEKSLDPAVDDFARAVLPDAFVTSCRREVKGSSIGKYDCVVLESGKSVQVDIPDGFMVSGIVVNANSKAKLLFDFDGRVVVKEVYSGGLSDDKVEVKYIPFFRPVGASRVVIKIAPCTMDITEKSPASWKRLTPYETTEADIFGVLVSRNLSVIDPAEKTPPCRASGHLSFKASQALREQLLVQFETAIDTGLKQGEMADLLRELSLVLEKNNRFEMAMKVICAAETLRPEGQVIRSIRTRQAAARAQREKLFGKRKP